MNSPSVSSDLSPAESEVRRPVSLETVRSRGNASRSQKFKAECLSFVSLAQSSDQIVEFCTAKDSWNQGMGSAGYELLRNGVVVARVLTRMN